MKRKQFTEEQIIGILKEAEADTLIEHFGATWAEPRPLDNRFAPRELRPAGRAYVVRRDGRGLGLDVMGWDVLGGQAPWPMTNIRNLGLPQWRHLAERPEHRCLVPLTEFCEWTPDKHDVGQGKPIKGEMWFTVTDQPLFAVAGLWQPPKDGARGFAMLTCPPNDVVAPIHPKAMITVLAREDQERWLTGSYAAVVALQRPYPATRMTVRGPESNLRDAAIKRTQFATDRSAAISCNICAGRSPCIRGELTWRRGNVRCRTRHAGQRVDLALQRRALASGKDRRARLHSLRQ